MSRSSSLGVELESESTIDAAMGLAIVQVDVHLWVPKSTTATITTNLGKRDSLCERSGILHLPYRKKEIFIRIEGRCYWVESDTYNAGGDHLDGDFLDQVNGPLIIHLKTL